MVTQVIEGKRNTKKVPDTKKAPAPKKDK